MNENIDYPSQLGQDRIALELLKFKTNGTFLDIGCYLPNNISNTFVMETKFGWRGLALDNNIQYAEAWQSRPNSKFICEDATKTNWKTLLSDNNMPKEIDFLSLDLEPPQLAFSVLKNLPFDDYRFNVIAFEHDDYRGTGTKQPSRDFLNDRGYILIKELKNEIGGQDDMWIHSSNNQE